MPDGGRAAISLLLIAPPRAIRWLVVLVEWGRVPSERGGPFLRQGRHGYHPCHRRSRFHRRLFRSAMLAEQACRVVNLDKLTYAGNLDSLARC